MGNHQRWSDDRVANELAPIVAELGRMPSSSELAARGLYGLSKAIQVRGGFLAWAQRLDVPSAGGRTYWTEGMVVDAIRSTAEGLGRMPSGPELHAAGRADLAAQIARRGGFKRWAERLGLAQKGTETHWAHRWEESEARFFRSLGADVERMSTRHPFDMLVNGHRVDVKASRWHEYAGRVRGYTFAGLKRGAHADFFDAVCIKDGVVAARFVVPAESARVMTLHLSPCDLEGGGKYGRFLNTIPPRLLGRAA